MIHRFLLLLMLVGLSVGAAGATPVLAQDASADVPMFRGNAARTGEMPGPGPAGDPVESWRFTTNGPGAAYSVTAHENTIYVGSNIGLHALDVASGAERWRFSTGDAVFSSPAVADEVVYVGSQDGNVYAVDAAIGGERWRFATGGKVDSSPAVVDGVVYVGSWDGRVYAIAGSLA